VVREAALEGELAPRHHPGELPRALEAEEPGDRFGGGPISSPCISRVLGRHLALVQPSDERRVPHAVDQPVLREREDATTSTPGPPRWRTGSGVASSKP
jgi:hypothetical protein